MNAIRKDEELDNIHSAYVINGTGKKSFLKMNAQKKH